MIRLSPFGYVSILFALSGPIHTSQDICGGIIEASSGNFSSPGYPSSYPANTSCVWDIHAPSRSNITLTFNHIDLDSSLRYCPNGDFIQVWGEQDGQSFWRSSAICGRITEPLVLRNVDNRMRILFKSDGTGEKFDGFSASFTSETGTECGAVLTNAFGDFTSPLFPDKYPPNRRCVWDILAPDGHRITLNFTEFDLENRTSTCPDKVIVWSRPSGLHFRRQVKFCGNQLPPSFRSQDNRLRVEFRSDSTIEAKGFSAVFYSDDQDVENECNRHQFPCNKSGHCIPKEWQCDGFDDCGDSSDETHCEGADPARRQGRHTGSCSHSVTTPLGEIVSPSYRAHDPKGRDCSWRFSTQPGHRIKLHFNDFAFLEHPDLDQDCQHDRLTFYEGPSRFSPIADYFCGLQELPVVVTSKGKDLFMTMKTASNTFWKGFNLTHSTVCGGEYEATEQANLLLSHYEFGEKNYSSNTSCTWSLRAAPGQRIELNFTTFDVCQNESNDICVDSSSPNLSENNDGQEFDCENDYVEITENRESVQFRIARICGNTIPDQILSTSDSLNILFVTNDVASSKGFSASYRSAGSYQ